MNHKASNRTAAVVRAHEQTREALETLGAELASGRSETLLALLRAFGTFHDYSLRNTLLIVSQRPDATRVAGFRAWKKLGRFVRKGEKGIVILAPIRRKAQVQVAADGDEAEHIYGFRPVYVFDVEQTEGEPLPTPAATRGEPGRYLQRLRSYASEHGIRVDYEEHGGSAMGSSAGGRIVIRSGLEPADAFATLVHELGHELLHQVVPPAQRPPRHVRETEAEAVAFAVCESIGLDARDAARDYIQLYDGDADVLAASFERVHRVSTRIVGYLRMADDEDAGSVAAAA